MVVVVQMMVVVAIVEVMFTDGIVYPRLAIAGPFFVHFIQTVDSFL